MSSCWSCRGGLFCHTAQFSLVAPKVLEWYNRQPAAHLLPPPHHHTFSLSRPPLALFMRPVGWCRLDGTGGGGDGRWWVTATWVFVYVHNIHVAIVHTHWSAILIAASEPRARPWWNRSRPMARARPQRLMLSVCVWVRGFRVWVSKWWSDLFTFLISCAASFRAAAALLMMLCCECCVLVFVSDTRSHTLARCCKHVCFDQHKLCQRSVRSIVLIEQSDMRVTHVTRVKWSW